MTASARIDKLPDGRGRAAAALAHWLETAAAWLLGFLWLFPLIYAFWAAFHPPLYATRFDLLAPLTLDNFREAWSQAPFARYYLNTFILVTIILIAQFILCTLAAYSFARFEFPGKSIAFALVLLQLMIMPEVLIGTVRSIVDPQPAPPDEA